MHYFRGNRYDYDHWQELGNDGWRYADVLSYFKKSEDQERGASEYHGVGGPIHVMDLSETNQLPHAFIEAGVELGWPRNNDYNGASQEGVGIGQTTQRQGQRESTATRYRHPVLHRPNLTVVTEALVTRVLFERTHTVGVAYLKDGVEQQERVNKEVLLSGGAINSPQLLMLSGIGSAEQLRTHGIDVVADLPGVGSNLQDHLRISINYTSEYPFSRFCSDAQIGAFVKMQPDLPEPNIQYHCHIGPSKDNYTVTIVLVRPQSSGHLMLQSNDPRHHPAIFANYLAVQADVETFVNAVKLARRLAQTKAFAPLNAVEIHPGLHVQSDQQIIEFLRNATQSTYHPVGTCKMGYDAMAVVDAYLRVHDVDGLRVIDASIMPTIVNANPYAPVIMIAERAANLIVHNV